MSLKKNFLIKSFDDYDVIFDLIKERAPKLLLFSGDLGAGKTTFIGMFLKYYTSINEKETCEGFMSPTFSIINQYEVNERTISHIDLYRLDLDEIYGLGLEEVVEESQMTFIEWYKKAEVFTQSLSRKVMTLDFKKIDENTREIKVSLK